jgi:hypothetical protein
MSAVNYSKWDHIEVGVGRSTAWRHTTDTPFVTYRSATMRTTLTPTWTRQVCFAGGMRPASSARRRRSKPRQSDCSRPRRQSQTALFGCIITSLLRYHLIQAKESHGGSEGQGGTFSLRRSWPRLQLSLSLVAVLDVGSVANQAEDASFAQTLTELEIQQREFEKKEAELERYERVRPSLPASPLDDPEYS